MANIGYNYGTKRVRQILGTLDTYMLEGAFDEVLKQFSRKYADYKYAHVDQTRPMDAHQYGYRNRSGYLDGATTKTVKFDQLYLEWQRSYDDDRELCIIGERDMDAGELAAYETNCAADKHVKEQNEMEYLRKLKQKYPNV